MGWQDRRYDEHEETAGGRFRRAMRRIFVEGDDFFSWSIPLFRVAGIDVRLHLLFLIYIVAELIRSLDRQAEGLLFAAYRLVALFALVLLHEFGHCLACRRVGGEADRILLWPLGGLAFCRPPHDWKANLITTLGGPGVNFVLVPIIGGVLLALKAGWGSVIYNPFDPGFRALAWYAYEPAYWKMLLLYLYQINLVLLLFNMLLVMYPMDAGRILQELIWRKAGYRKSLIYATNAGMVMAVVVAVISMVALPDQPMLFGIALFCGITCFVERRRAMLLDEDFVTGSLAEYGYGPRAAPSRAAPDRKFEAAIRRQKREQEEQAEVDRILAKIAESGMQSLSRLERKTLEEATRRKRDDGGVASGRK